MQDKRERERGSGWRVRGATERGFFLNVRFISLVVFTPLALMCIRIHVLVCKRYVHVMGRQNGKGRGFEEEKERCTIFVRGFGGGGMKLVGVKLKRRWRK